ncbi:MAG: RnfABCDGE type electron transport complex subunit D [Firmicutes bacterium]|nr:RnfABCDGE type electron transport complex subunit D [Bacillota bacterium]
MERQNLIVSPSPHFTNKGFFRAHTTQSIMMHVCIALIPALIASVLFFGPSSLVIVLLCVAACIVGELLFNLAAKQKLTINDFSAVVTGLILGLNLPIFVNEAGDPTPFAHWYIPVVGGLFAIIVVKMIFGGIGKNFANPAATARLFVFFAFGAAALYPIYHNTFEYFQTISVLGGATPLQAVSEWFAGSSWGDDPMSSIAPVALWDMFIGRTGGVIGETSVLALLIGGVYLGVLRIIDWRIPVIYMGGTFLLILLLTGSLNAGVIHLLGGGLVFGAIFMATDYASSPKSDLGIYIYAAGLALITVLIRLFTALPEGVSFAIVLMNLVNPLMDKYFIHKPFGYVKPVKPA